MATIKGWKFPIQVDKDTGKIQMIEDNENVKQDVRIILGTEQYERKIYANFGTNTRSFMFETVDPVFMTNLKRTIEDSLKIWEKHISELDVEVNAPPGPISKVEVNIDYTTDIIPVQERYTHEINTSGD